ncbi:macro domain-containing protein [Micromonospora sp. LOL_024]|uniref:type II toxin-antitoxin system antitoxin DNA ADP-ribosyl glycohydrolase DarG n=1 Tax=Micromonospora sp. LOL_024 TaxID=3345412 RepID=UPI003A8479CD
MIILSRGNLLIADVDALVNTVNTVGVMGKGIALQFKRAYPANYAAYRSACAKNEVRLGQMLVFNSARLGPRRFVINFPTKGHWRATSALSDIHVGLADLVRVVRDRQITSIAVPALGCGNGGLDWKQVRPAIEQAFTDLPDVRVLLFPPPGAPDPAGMPVATSGWFSG